MITAVGVPDTCHREVRGRNAAPPPAPCPGVHDSRGSGAVVAPDRGPLRYGRIALSAL